MAKSKFAPRKGPGLLNRMIARATGKDERLKILAVEIGLAGAQVLQEDFGFTQKQTAIWVDKLLDRLDVNRAASLAMMAKEQVENGQSKPD